MQTSELILFAGVLIAVLLTFLWMAAHAYGLFKLGGNLNQISRRAGITWIISGIGAFMGPCVIPLSLVALVMAIMEQRQDDVGPHTAVALRTIIASSVLILLMAAVLIAVSLGSVALTNIGT